MSTPFQFPFHDDEHHSIAIAVGMLMERANLSHGDALERLVDLARTDRVRLIDAASIVIHTKF